MTSLANPTTNFQYDNQKVSFPSIQDQFNLAIDTINNGFKIWIESKRSKKQWELNVIDSELGNYTSNPPPKINIVCKYLTNAFAKIESTSSVDASYDTDGDSTEFLIIHLTISHHILNDLWQVFFDFKLNPKSINDTDKVESRLRDTNEEVLNLHTEIEILKKSLKNALDLINYYKPKCLLLHSFFGMNSEWVKLANPRYQNTNECNHIYKIKFDGTNNIIDPTCFKISPDLDKIQGILI